MQRSEDGLFYLFLPLTEWFPGDELEGVFGQLFPAVSFQEGYDGQGRVRVNFGLGNGGEEFHDSRTGGGTPRRPRLTRRRELARIEEREWGVFCLGGLGRGM